MLVVDDEKAVADFMRELLESWGLEATAETNPLGVLERVARERYDFVILDQTMPGITGVSLAREIAAAARGCRSSTPATATESTARSSAPPGCGRCLQKPVEPAARCTRR